MRLFIQETLSHEYSVITAQNGLEALEIIRKADQSIDLILTDLMMPQMDGFKLIKLLKEKKETADIPILVLTAMQEELAKVEVLESGVNDFLTKPFAVQELLIKVKSILSDKSIQKMWAEEQKLLHAAGTIDQEDNRKSSLLDTIKDFVLENIDDVDFNVDRLADQLNMSKRNLYRFVQEVDGQTPLKLVRDIKLDVAKRYLEDAVFDNLRDVVYASGFNTIRHFRKSYSERFQKDPSDFFES
jgi:CheY-like chemotaxis protein